MHYTAVSENWSPWKKRTNNGILVEVMASNRACHKVKERLVLTLLIHERPSEEGSVSILNTLSIPTLARASAHFV